MSGQITHHVGVDALDELIAKLRSRVADPKRRTDAPQSVSMRGPGGTLSTTFGNLFGAGSSPAAGATGTGGTAGNPLASLGSILGDLRRVVDANQAGRPIDPDIRARVDQSVASMSTSNSSDLPAPATTATLDAAQERLRLTLPLPLRRLYAEVADGGFGPGGGLLGIGAAVDAYLELRGDPPGPRGQAWPEGLLPLVDRDVGYDCIDVATGAIVEWDPEDLTERSGAAAWQRSFGPLAPSLEAWLGGWVDSRPQHEVIQERVDREMVTQARAARARFAAMTPEERAGFGLPAVGWEKVVWGGIGLEPDEEPPT